MDLLILVIGVVLMLIGLVGCFVPVIPGPPICYVSLLVIHFFSDYTLADDFLINWAIIMTAITVLDIWLQIYGVKRFGGKKMAIRGTTIGLVLGLFIPPFGFVVGPFIGAFVGAYLESTDKDFVQVTKIAFGSFIGLLSGVVLKVVVCGVMIFQLFTSILK
ncbi:DUF456 domain-containing protein [Flavobacteriales bacterium]|nr:DUF456 domain-containing protein [Flavobacteriales bacterium]